MNFGSSDSGSCRGRQNNWLSFMKKEKEIVLSDILPEFKNLSEFWEFFPTEQSCIDYLEEHL